MSRDIRKQDIHTYANTRFERQNLELVQFFLYLHSIVISIKEDIWAQYLMLIRSIWFNTSNGIMDVYVTNAKA